MAPGLSYAAYQVLFNLPYILIAPALLLHFILLFSVLIRGCLRKALKVQCSACDKLLHRYAKIMKAFSRIFLAPQDIMAKKIDRDDSELYINNHKISDWTSVMMGSFVVLFLCYVLTTSWIYLIFEISYDCRNNIDCFYYTRNYILNHVSNCSLNGPVICFGFTFNLAEALSSAGV